MKAGKMLNIFKVYRDYNTRTLQTDGTNYQDILNQLKEGDIVTGEYRVGCKYIIIILNEELFEIMKYIENQDKGRVKLVCIHAIPKNIIEEYL